MWLFDKIAIAWCILFVAGVIIRGNNMRLFDKIAIALCVFCVAGVIIWSSAVFIAASNGAMDSLGNLPPQGFWVFGAGWGTFLNNWFRWARPVFFWMQMGLPGVFIFGLYFCISRRVPLRRAMMLLCFLATWVIILMSAQFVLKGLSSWVID